MFPLKDTIRSHTVPIITWLLIAANGLVFLYELRLPPIILERLIYTFGVVPANLEIYDPSSWYTLVTSQFLHGGWFHFLSNMWILFIFGDNVEDRMGSLRFFLFYILGGIAAGVIQSVFNHGSSIPAIGASGAISAVLGAYFLFFPAARVITLIPLWIIPWFVEIPALIFIGFWFISQLFSGLLSLATTSGMQMGGVAWWAHIGGFIFGIFCARLFVIRRPAAIWYPDEYNPW